MKTKACSIITFHDSPNIGYSASLNPYHGCEKIFPKTKAAALLRKELLKKKYKPQVLAMGSITDCYQPIEKELGLTRQCLEVLLLFRNPVVIITKSHLVTRDIDILSELNRFSAIHVCIPITTLDKNRLLIIKELHEAKIPVSINVAPIIPGLTEHEIPKILESASKMGAQRAHYILPQVHTGGYAVQLAKMFSHCRKLYGLNKASKLSIEHFVRAKNGQLSLF